LRPEELSNNSSISLSRNLHPQQLFTRSPLYTREIGLRDFARLVVERWTLESPNADTVNTDLSLSYWDFTYRDFSIRDVKQLVLPTPNPDSPKLRCARELDFSTPHHLYRDFRLQGIAKPDANVSGLLTTKPKNGVPPIHSSTSLWPTLSSWLSGYRVLQFRDSCCTVHGTSTHETPIHDFTCKSNDPCGSDLWSCPPEL
jgi:hypothetical protein